MPVLCCKIFYLLQSYEETLAYLYDQLPMFSRIGAAAYKADLGNTVALCAAFGNPEKKFKSIHIAGTNGKGSTSHMLAAIFQQAGYKTGLYTSPHLKDFRERIKVSPEKTTADIQPLQMISKEFVVEFTASAQPFIEALQPSFFELTVVMAFEYFARQKVDIAIIETGLGGRLDSTNVVMPELSVITNISLDHTHLLGNTLEAIAGEKAGIIKRNVPVVVGQKAAATEGIFMQKADAEKAILAWAEERMILKSYEATAAQLVAEWRRLGSADLFSIATDLPGLYQLKNVATVLTAVELLNEKGWQLAAETVATALQQVKKLTGLHGRWEKIHDNPTVILDVGHNEDGVKQIVEQLSLQKEGTVHIVLGMVKDKAIEAVLELFPANYHYYFTQAHLPRALPAAELQARAAAAGLLGDEYSDVNKALQAALSAATPADTILVCGSVFLVGEVDRERLQTLP